MLSENIKVSEVSDILRKQLEGIDTRVQLDEIGTVPVSYTHLTLPTIA